MTQSKLKIISMSKAKISIRFIDDREVRALWDEVVSATNQLKFVAPDEKNA